MQTLSNGVDLKTLSRGLVEALDPDKQLEHAQQQTGDTQPDAQTLESITENLKRQAINRLAILNYANSLTNWQTDAKQSLLIPLAKTKSFTRAHSNQTAKKPKQRYKLLSNI